MDMDIQKIELVEKYTRLTKELKRLTDNIETSPIGASKDVEEFLDLTIERNRLSNTISMTIGDNTFHDFETIGLYDYRKSSFEEDTDYLLHSYKLKKEFILERLRNEALKCCIKHNLIEEDDFIDQFPTTDKLSVNLEKLKSLRDFQTQYYNTEYKQMMFFSKFVDKNISNKSKNYTYHFFNEELQQYLYCILNLRVINTDENVFSSIYDTIKNYIIRTMIEYFEELEEFINAFRKRFNKTYRKTHVAFLNHLNSAYNDLKYTLHVLEEREA